MKLEIREAAADEKTVLWKMLQLYLYDLSEFSGDELNDHGEYMYNYLDLYWIEEDRHPYLVKIKGNLAGFVLVGDYVVSKEADISIAEFFIMKEYRRKKVGRRVAHKIFNTFRGTWEVRAIAGNKPAVKFWNKTIKSYSKGTFRYLKDGINQWDGPLWTFSNA